MNKENRHSLLLILNEEEIVLMYKHIAIIDEIMIAIGNDKNPKEGIKTKVAINLTAISIKLTIELFLIFPNARKNILINENLLDTKSAKNVRIVK